MVKKTKQEMFDHTFVCLARQGRPSINYDTNSCQYRTDEGLRCAVGWSCDSSFTEDYSCHSLRNLQILEDAGFDPMFMRTLQRAHDESFISEVASPERRDLIWFGMWISKMMDIARIHELSMSLAMETLAEPALAERRRLAELEMKAPARRL
jgi:hypothetical protein